MALAHALKAALDTDIARSFRASPTVVASAGLMLLLVLAALLAPWITPQNPWDPASLQLMNSFNPPVWHKDGTSEFVLGSDDQGRDMLSAILYGLRVSLIVGFLARCWRWRLASPWAWRPAMSAARSRS